MKSGDQAILQTRPHSLGFTIVELLIVIVVIGILAAISIVAYNGIQQRAIIATITSDLDSSSKQIQLFQITTGNYPVTVTDCPSPAASNICLKPSHGNTFTGLQTAIASGTQSFCLNVKNSTNIYHITQSSNAEIGACPKVNAGLVAYYPFDTDTKDHSGNGNDGTLSGASLTAGMFNSGYSFNSPSTYVTLPNDLGYSSQFSAFVWFKSQGAPGDSYHILFGGQELEISIPTSGELRTGVYTTARFVSNHGSGLLDGNWHFIGMTFDGLTKVSYIDGVNVGSLTTSGALTNVFATRRIGVFGNSTTYYANGAVDEVRIYNRVLTQSEITELYTP